MFWKNEILANYCNLLQVIWGKKNFAGHPAMQLTHTTLCILRILNKDR